MYRLNRILDANINRAAEGIRVVEDICRFYFEDIPLTETLRNMRHTLRKTLAQFDFDYINARDSEHDIGREISAVSSLDNKTSIRQLVNANFKRAEEAFRVLEETLKVKNLYKESKVIETLRYESYTIEKRITFLLKKEIPQGLYCITDLENSRGRTNIEVVKEMVKGGAKIIQYREKNMTSGEKLRECRIIREITKAADVIFIVNDNIDIAILSEADGVHLGQDDIPINEARKLIGDKIIGISTHSPEQAEKAVKDGADYIGIGPIFATPKKEHMKPVGIELVEYASKNIKIPFVVIGGIKIANIDKVIAGGAKNICLVSEITAAEDIQGKIREINDIIKM